VGSNPIVSTETAGRTRAGRRPQRRRRRPVEWSQLEAPGGGGGVWRTSVHRSQTVAGCRTSACSCCTSSARSWSGWRPASTAVVSGPGPWRSSLATR